MNSGLNKTVDCRNGRSSATFIEKFRQRAPEIGIKSDPDITADLIDFEHSLNSIVRQIDDIASNWLLFHWTGMPEANVEHGLFRNSDRHVRVWAFTAAQHIFIQIRELEVFLNDANKQLAALKTHLGEDTKVPKPTAFGLLEQYFPDRIKLRDKSAHHAEPLTNGARGNKHASSDEFQRKGIRMNFGGTGKLVMGGNIIEDEYSATWKGEHIRLTIDLQMLDNLEEIKTTFFKTIPEVLLRR